MGCTKKNITGIYKSFNKINLKLNCLFFLIFQPIGTSQLYSAATIRTIMCLQSLGKTPQPCLFQTVWIGGSTSV